MHESKPFNPPVFSTLLPEWFDPAAVSPPAGYPQLCQATGALLTRLEVYPRTWQTFERAYRSGERAFLAEVHLLINSLFRLGRERRVWEEIRAVEQAIAAYVETMPQPKSRRH